MRVLVTRPQADGEALAQELRQRGHEPVLAPLLEVHVRDDVAVDLSDVQALLFTSANGVRALSAATTQRDVRVLAVGEASAQAAAAAGFRQVESAGGDADDLARLVRARLDPQGGDLLHPAGRVIRGDLGDALAGDGYRVRRLPLYDAVSAARLPEAARTAIAARRLDAALFFSPRTARTFVTLIRQADLAPACQDVDAVCLSPAVAEAAAALTWRHVRVAARPERAALLAALESAAADGQA